MTNCDIMMFRLTAMTWSWCCGTLQVTLVGKLREREN